MTEKADLSNSKLYAGLTKYKYELLLGVVILFHVVGNLVWLRLDTAPLPPDPSHHSIIAYEMADCLRNIFTNGITTCLERSPFYPPFAHTVVGFMGNIFGKSVMLPRIMSTIFFGLTLVAIYLWAKHFYDSKKAALFTVVLYSLVPEIYSSSRFFWVEVPLTLITFATLYILDKSHSFKDKPLAITAFSLLGIGMLTKWTIAAYLFIPFVLAFATSLRRDGPSYTLKTSGIGLFFTLLIFGPWVLINYQQALAIGTYTSFSSFLTKEQTLLQVIVDKIFFYPKWLINFGYQLVPFVFFMLSLPNYIKHTSFKKLNYVFGTILLNITAFSMLVLRDPRYLFPILPIFFSVTAFGIVKLNKRFVNIMTGGIIILLVLQFFKFSFDTPKGISYRLPIKLPILEWVNIVHYDSSSYPAYPYYRSFDWPNEEIMDDVYNLSKGNAIKFQVIAGWTKLNDRYLLLYAKEKGYTNIFINEDIPFGIKDGFANDEAINDYIKTKDYFLVPELEWAQSYTLFKPVIDPLQRVLLDPSNNNIKLVKKYKIPYQEVNKYLKELRQPADIGVRYDACEKEKCEDLLLFKVLKGEDIYQGKYLDVERFDSQPDSCTQPGMCDFQLVIPAKSFVKINGSPMQYSDYNWNYNADEKEYAIWFFANENDKDLVVNMSAWAKANVITNYLVNTKTYTKFGELMLGEGLLDRDNIKKENSCNENECNVKVGLGLWECNAYQCVNIYLEDPVNNPKN